MRMPTYDSDDLGCASGKHRLLVAQFLRHRTDYNRAREFSDESEAVHQGGKRSG